MAPLAPGLELVQNDLQREIVEMWERRDDTENDAPLIELPNRNKRRRLNPSELVDYDIE